MRANCAITLRWALLLLFLLKPTGALAEQFAASPPDKKTAVSTESDDQEFEKPLGNVNLTPQAIKEAGFTLKVPESKTLVMTVELSGEVTLNGDRLARIAPKVPGTVIEVKKGIGDLVREGDALAVLESTELGAAKIEYFSVLSVFELAQRDFERDKTLHDNSARMLDLLKGEPDPVEIEKKLKDTAIGENKAKLLKVYSELRLSRSAATRADKLKEDKLISGADYDTTRKNLESAQVEFSGTLEEIRFSITQKLFQSDRAVRLAQNTLRNGQRRLHLLGLSEADVTALAEEKSSDVSRYVLRAPFAGTVVERSINVGEQHEANGHAFMVTDLSTVWVMLSVFPKHGGQVKAGQAVTIRVHGQEKTFSGKIAAVTPFVDERTRAATARVVLENKDGLLRPGMFVTAEVIVQEASVPMAVPVGAVQVVDNKKVVFLKGCNNTEFKAQPVTLGRISKTFAEVRLGLVEDDLVVSTGNTFLLKAEFGKGTAKG